MPKAEKAILMIDKITCEDKDMSRKDKIRLDMYIDGVRHGWPSNNTGDYAVWKSEGTKYVDIAEKVTSESQVQFDLYDENVKLGCKTLFRNHKMPSEGVLDFVKHHIYFVPSMMASPQADECHYKIHYRVIKNALPTLRIFGIQCVQQSCDTDTPVVDILDAASGAGDAAEAYLRQQAAKRATRKTLMKAFSKANAFLAGATAVVKFLKFLANRKDEVYLLDADPNSKDYNVSASLFPGPGSDRGYKMEKDDELYIEGLYPNSHTEYIRIPIDKRDISLYLMERDLISRGGDLLLGGIEVKNVDLWNGADGRMDGTPKFQEATIKDARNGEGALYYICYSIGMEDWLLPATAEGQEDAVIPPRVPNVRVENGVSQLLEMEYLMAGDHLLSPNGRFELQLHVDGELVAYDQVCHKPYWRTSTPGRGNKPYRFGLDEDGDLAVFDNSRQMIWSKTLAEDKKKGSFRIEDDGDLCYFGDSKLEWSSGTGMIVEENTTCVEEGATTVRSGSHIPENTVIKSDYGEYGMKLRSDGNLVAYSLGTNEVVWESKTGGKGSSPYKLVFHSDGGLVIHDGKGSLTWSAGSSVFGSERNSMVETGILFVSVDGGITVMHGVGSVVFSTTAVKREDTLLRVETIFDNHSQLVSPSGRFVMKFVDDSNADGCLICYDSVGQQEYWRPKFKEGWQGPCTLHLQSDSRLVVRDNRGERVWSSWTRVEAIVDSLDDAQKDELVDRLPCWTLCVLRLRDDGHLTVEIDWDVYLSDPETDPEELPILQTVLGVVVLAYVIAQDPDGAKDTVEKLKEIAQAIEAMKASDRHLWKNEFDAVFDEDD